MWWRGRIGGTGTRGGPGGGGNSGGGWLGFQRKERVYRSRGPARGGVATWGGEGGAERWIGVRKQSLARLPPIAFRVLA